LVADARASTPTKAGVIAVRDMQEVLEQLAYLQQRLESKVEFIVYSDEQLSDELCMRLARSIKQLLAETRVRLYSLDEQIRKIEPHRLLGKKTIDLNDLKNRTNAAIQAVVKNRWMQLIAQENRLAGLNPKSVLQRGYSITTNKRTRLLVRNLKDIQIGDFMITELADENLIESKVTKK